MGWKEGDSLRKSLQGMTTNLRAFHLSNNVSVGANTDLPGDSGWSKTNKNFGGILKMLKREHQEGTSVTGRTDGPRTSTAATAIASSSDAGLYPDSRGRE